MIIWEGESPIDSKPLVAIMTGLKQASVNPKTGRMAQVWIIRSDIHPQEALKGGEDYSICGNCVHRKNPTTGKRTCYVKPMPVNAVYMSFKKGIYPTFSEQVIKKIRDPIRWGAYGDPVCIPIDVIDKVHDLSGQSWTGYTHQWRDPRFNKYKRLFHASCDSFEDYKEASQAEWSTFQTLKKGETPIKGKQAACQGSIKTTCDQCLLCRGTNGTKATHITVPVHGYAKNYYL